jgi:hypothetical protein
LAVGGYIPEKQKHFFVAHQLLFSSKRRKKALWKKVVDKDKEI